MIKKYWDRFNEWPTTHFICIGAVISFVRATPETFLEMVALCTLLCSFIYWPVKAFLITGETAATMIANGEPLFKAGGLSEYDSTRARRTGEAAGEAMARELRRYDREKQEKLDNQ